jgi:phosphonate transport system substrate-binding protein
VIARVFSNYQVLMRILEEGRAHIVWLPPLTYIYASQRGLAEVVLLTNHFGVYQYGAQFMANVENGFTPYYDPISGLNSTDAATALQQFAGWRPCWVEPLSASGYIVPAGLLDINQVPVLPAVLTQSHTATVRALYIKGVCDFGATFSISGDPRTAAAVLDDLPDAMDRVLILWRTDGIIPSLNLSLLAGLSERDRQALTNGILEIARTTEGKVLLSYASGDYQIDDIKPIDNGLYDPLRELVDTLNINLNDLIGK